MGVEVQLLGLLIRVLSCWSAQAGVVALVEALGEQVELVLDCAPDVRARLLAVLATAVAAEAAPADARFACLKLLCDATLARLCFPGDTAGALALHACQRRPARWRVQVESSAPCTGTQLCSLESLYLQTSAPQPCTPRTSTLHGRAMQPCPEAW